MRKLALLSAVLVMAATPAQAAEFYRATFRAFGTTTILDPYMCSPADCMPRTYNDSIFFGAQLFSYSRTPDQWILYGDSQGSKVGGSVTLNYVNGALVSSEFSGRADYLSGFARVTGEYFARNFAIEDVSETGVVRVIAPVPEPSTWAMMLAGFAGIGLALRSRRRRQAAYA